VIEGFQFTLGAMGAIAAVLAALFAAVMAGGGILTMLERRGRRR
jgi:hypothetical protein